MAQTDFWPQIQAKLEDDGAPTRFIELFREYYGQLVSGETGLIPESDLEPVRELDDADQLSTSNTGREALSRTVMIKLNGGLGTSMGLQGPKSLLPVRGRRTFLEIIARQAAHDDVPLILMNSDATEAESLAFLDQLHLQDTRMPRSFRQHRIPKIRQDNFAPVAWTTTELEWCPPGHGDLYTALLTSGVMEHILSAGFRYAFVSNADNLGAVIDAAILGYMVERDCPFLMEVADRTEMDRKGGHVARRRSDGQLLLRESAQCSPSDEGSFQDVEKYSYFNTNNLWIDLRRVRDLLTAERHMLLPLIRNSKTVDPRDAASPGVYQLETAMGSAIAVMAGASAIRVSRKRFAPVKSTHELLLVRSDAFVETDQHRIVPHPDWRGTTVELDARYYKFVDELDSRFPHGPPSMLNCRRLRVDGDIRFGRNVVLNGNVALQAPPNSVPDRTIIGDSAEAGIICH
ncbi:MAG: UTP--glucose-1-phosphate uridylyltransferase [Planctomycetota bacterium]|nr:UTP--glucose-1-phosphate uridylyltransferase [Planctomycetota bacterium]